MGKNNNNRSINITMVGMEPEGKEGKEEMETSPIDFCIPKWAYIQSQRNILAEKQSMQYFYCIGKMSKDEFKKRTYPLIIRYHNLDQYIAVLDDYEYEQTKRMYNNI